MPKGYRQASCKQIKVRQWRADSDTALLTPVLAGPIHPERIENCLSHLVEAGINDAHTAAVSEQEAASFIEAGFTKREILHLLSRPIQPSDIELDKIDNPELIQTARVWHRDRILEIDNLAFQDKFWRFDKIALKDAQRATPLAITTLAVENDQVVGYAIVGISRHEGYIQRLAVEPEKSGKGYGSALIRHSLSWLAKRGALEVRVNTQQNNQRALDLYERMGFTMQDQSLVVLRWAYSGEGAC